MNLFRTLKYQGKLRKTIVLLCLSVLVVLLVVLWMIKPSVKWNEDLERLRTGDYQGVFFSMFPIDTFNEEDFHYFRALSTAKVSYHLKSVKEISAFLEDVFDIDSTYTNFYFGLDPTIIGKAYNFQSNRYIRAITNLLIPHIMEHPDTTFEILLPFDSLEKWGKLSAKEAAASIQAYRDIVPILTSQPNVRVYHLGSEEWLIANPANYEGDQMCHPDISKFILALTFRDDVFLVKGATIEKNPSLESGHSMEENLTRLESLIAANANSQGFPDLSDVSVVFFGDSNIGNFSGSLSIPGVVNAFTEAKIYNLALGGTSAARNRFIDVPVPDSSFTTFVNALVREDLSLIPPDSNAYQNMQDFWQAEHGNICFILNYGLNDYFSGLPVYTEDPYDPSSYTGALRLGIMELLNAYPDAYIIIMTPSYTTLFSEGMDKNSEYGSVLTDYVDAALSLSDTPVIHGMNNYKDLGINTLNQHLYLEDGCHYSPQGRYLLGLKIIEKLNDIFPIS